MDWKVWEHRGGKPISYLKTAPKSIKIVAQGLNNGGGADMVVPEYQVQRGEVCFQLLLLFLEVVY